MQKRDERRRTEERKRRTAQAPSPTAVLWTMQQCSAWSGVPYMSVRQLVLSGHLPSVRLGDSRRTWVRRADYQRLIAASTEARVQADV